MTKRKTRRKSFEVTYQIVPMGNFFTQVTYTGRTGEPVVVTDVTTFRSGVKKVAVSTRPFIAKISTEVNNTTPTTQQYTLAISVKGKVKAMASALAPPMAISVTTAEHTVE